jgi:hypothetical protein
MASKLLSIISRNFLILFHSKLSSLIILVGPLILIMIIGAALGNTGLKDINANVYTAQPTDFSDAFIKNLQARSFIITKTSSLEECLNGVKNSEKSICIEIKKSNVQIQSNIDLNQSEIDESGFGSEIELYADFSKQRVVWDIINNVRMSVEDFSSKIRTGISLKIQENLENSDRKIKDKRLKINETISIIDSVETKIPDVKSRMQKDSTDITTSLNQLEFFINQLNQSDQISQSVYNSFFRFKSSWDSLDYENSRLYVINNLDNFEKNLQKAKVELIQIDRDRKSVV